MEYGLIGKPLKHSFSKQVHSQIADYNYELHELDESYFNEFMTSRNFKAINVTIPYKKKVLSYISKLSPDAREIGAVNTVVNIKGELYGFNTDIYGVIATFDHFKVNFQGKNVLILGTGATSNTIYSAVEKCGAASIYKAYRNTSRVKGDVLYEDIKQISSKINILINATACGTYPNIFDNELVNLDDFKKLEFIMDVVYNPYRTKLISDAESRGIKTATGLYMLISQAVYASKIFVDDNIIQRYDSKELFTKKEVGDINKTTSELFYKYLSGRQNIVLIGMPGCGKSTIGRKMSRMMDKEFIDTDELIEQKVGMSPSEYITKYGEEKFREVESDVIKEISDKQSVIIATGGGAILRDENVQNLKLYGKLFFINRPIGELQDATSRPLTGSEKLLAKVYKERLPIYKKVCDEEILSELDIAKEIKNILDKS